VEDEASGIWHDISALPLAAFVRDADWAYPILEVLHVIGLALIFTPIMLFDLRVLGAYRDMALSRWRQALLPWVWCGFALNAISGLLMFASDAAEFVANTAFQIKMGLLLLAGLNALAFQWRLQASITSTTNASGAAKASAMLSILLWLAIICAGRLIAYIT
jgi:hypothetical protein